MKALVFLLVLANLLFYAFSAGYFGQAEQPDAGRLAQQVAPEKMRLVSRGEAPAAKPEKAPPAPEPVVEAPAASPKPAVVAESVCLRWDRLAQADANRLSALISEKFAGFKQAKRPLTAEGSTWWVYIPPLPSKEDADRKAGELRKLGVTDYFIVQEAGLNRFAISLGIFSSEKGGQDRWSELKSRGVRSARLSIRPGKDSLVTLEATGPASDKAALLAAVSATLPKPSVESCK